MYDSKERKEQSDYLRELGFESNLILMQCLIISTLLQLLVLKRYRTRRSKTSTLNRMLAVEIRGYAFRHHQICKYTIYFFY